jgi:glucose/arabinose dehydrogenase
VPSARSPVALTPLTGGGFLYAERLTGRVRRVGPDGRLDPQAVARVAVSTVGQRGLLGLAVDARDRVFGAFTRPDPPFAIEVVELAPTPRVVWEGPPSTRLANGGHLIFDPARERLVLGVGDLESRAAVADPDTPNGKLLLLDPDGPADQRPDVLSKGWNNPFAFTLTAEGDLWVADNVPGEAGERMAPPGTSRVTVPPLPATTSYI